MFQINGKIEKQLSPVIQVVKNWHSRAATALFADKRTVFLIQDGMQAEMQKKRG